MKKHLLAAVMCAMTAISPLFGQQHVQSLSFSGPSTIDIRSTTNTFTLSVNLTFSGYSAVALSYFLEVQNALAPFLTVTDVTCSTLPCPPPGPTPIPFNNTAGDPGYSGEPYDLGGAVNNPFTEHVPPGRYHVTDITLMLAPGTPLGMYDLRSTTLVPRNSEVTSYPDFTDNNLPAAHFTINIVPEPSALALLGIGAIASGLIANRRRR